MGLPRFEDLPAFESNREAYLILSGLMVAAVLGVGVLYYYASQQKDSHPEVIEDTRKQLLERLPRFDAPKKPTESLYDIQSLSAFGSSTHFTSVEQSDAYLNAMVTRIQNIRGKGEERLKERNAILDEHDDIVAAMYYLLKRDDFEDHTEWLSQVSLRIMGMRSFDGIHNHRDSAQESQQIDDFYEKVAALKRYVKERRKRIR